MPRPRTDGGPTRDPSSRTFEGTFDLEELRRRNNVALGMDVLYLDVPVLIPHPGWPAAVALVPLATLLYFGWSSSKPFFVAQLLAIAVTVAADVTGLLPL